MVHYTTKTYQKHIQKSAYHTFVMGVDIGGTHTNIGIAGVNKHKQSVELLFSHHFETKKLSSVIPAIKETYNYSKHQFDIEINFMCIGAAGVVDTKKNSAQLTNVSWNIDAKKIREQTEISNVFIINDFQILGFGIHLLDENNENDVFKIQTGKTQTPHPTKAVIGAGSGLGKSILIYDEEANIYVPLASEGGHADIPTYTEEERNLLHFIQTKTTISYPINYEHILSGKGIEFIYSYLHKRDEFKETEYTKKIDESTQKTLLISKYKNRDETCRKTFELFIKFYARCAKNFALDTMALGGIYLAGGIAMKNQDIFHTDLFAKEFQNAFRRSKLLASIPVYLVLDYDISLTGACFAAVHYHKKIKNKAK